MPESGMDRMDRQTTSKQPSKGPGNAYRVVARLPPFLGKLKQGTISSSFNFTKLLAETSFLRTYN